MYSITPDNTGGLTPEFGSKPLSASCQGAPCRVLRVLPKHTTIRHQMPFIFHAGIAAVQMAMTP